MNKQGRILGLVVAVTAIVGGTMWRGDWSPDAVKTASISVPEFSPRAVAGKRSFDKYCVECHGENAMGTEQGPPLLHDIYNPGHHADPSFRLAAKRGVRQHHWRFGNMAPVPQVSERQVDLIIRYVRELQEANGITYKPHRM